MRFLWWEIRRRRRGDETDLLGQLAGSKPPPNYSATERYRDFHVTFLATDSGRRVLWQILEWCRLMRSPHIKDDAYATHIRIGEQNIGRRLLVVLMEDPPAQPERTNERTTT